MSLSGGDKNFKLIMTTSGREFTTVNLSVQLSLFSPFLSFIALLLNQMRDKNFALPFCVRRNGLWLHTHTHTHICHGDIIYV